MSNVNVYEKRRRKLQNRDKGQEEEKTSCMKRMIAKQALSSFIINHLLSRSKRLRKLTLQGPRSSPVLTGNVVLLFASLVASRKIKTP